MIIYIENGTHDQILQKKVGWISNMRNSTTLKVKKKEFIKKGNYFSFSNLFTNLK